MARRAWLAAWIASCWLSAHAAGLAVVGTELTDNGDHDGYADTNETVELRLTVRNTTGVGFTGVTAHLSSPPGRTICLIDGSASIGDLPPGAVVTATEPLVFHVCSDRDRAGLGLSAFDPFTATFDLSFTASPSDPPAHPDRLVFDLDLDVAGAGSPVSITEDFEGAGFGLFQVQNLDLGRHDDLNAESGPSNGYRCQYHEPYCTHAICNSDPPFQFCSLGATATAADGIWWRIDGPTVPGGGRGFSGSHSLYFGEPLGEPLGYTTPLGVLEAVATTAPIHLSGGSPALTFKQQASFADPLIIGNVPPGEAADRGVVAVQLADATGAPAGPWIKIDPSLNVHDALPTSGFLNCSFDPVDDGNTGDTLFAGYSPADGLSRRGPSSTCAEERAFARMGSTAGAFDPLATGNADGPGLAGATGPGTWVETRYDLSRFRGRSIRVRFVASTTRVQNFPTWEAAGFATLVPEGDDGWWIDDVTIEGASAVPGVVSIDSHDNSGLAADTDADGIDDLCDNCPLVANPSQADTDADGAADACDLCPLDAANDTDADGVCGNVDNCVAIPNPSQANADGDTFGDACDLCPLDAANDADADGLCGNVDNCSGRYNPAQGDADADLRGDLCDNCPLAANAAQADGDADGAGDVCDCQPNDSSDRQGPPVTLSIRQLGTQTELSWPAYIAADSYSITRGDLASLGPGQYGECLSERINNLYYDTSVPAPGSGFFYLVQAQNWDCGLGPLSTAEKQAVNTNPLACAGIPIADSHPSSQTTVAGTVTGTLAGTQTSDDQVESIQEVVSSGGSPSQRFSLLEHRFTFTMGPGLDRRLHVEGFRSSSADGDDFRFEASTDGGVSFFPLSLTLPLLDDDVDRIAVVGGESSSVIIRVVDTNRAPGTQSLDTVSIDEIWMRAAAP
jgi:hypothetical protein